MILNRVGRVAVIRHHGTLYRYTNQNREGNDVSLKLVRTTNFELKL